MPSSSSVLFAFERERKKSTDFGENEVTRGRSREERTSKKSSGQDFREIQNSFSIALERVLYTPVGNCHESRNDVRDMSIFLSTVSDCTASQWSHRYSISYVNIRISKFFFLQFTMYFIHDAGVVTYQVISLLF